MLTQERDAEVSASLELSAEGDGMYAQELNQNGTTKHSRHCEAAFGRYDWRCHRCIELRMGRRPRVGWEQDYFRRKLAQAQRPLAFGLGE